MFVAIFVMISVSSFCMTMTTCIATVVVRFMEIKVRMVMVSNMNPEYPFSMLHIDRAVEVFHTHKSTVLVAIEHPAQVVVSVV